MQTRHNDSSNARVLWTAGALDDSPKNSEPMSLTSLSVDRDGGLYVWDRNRPGIWNVNPTNGSLSPTWQAGRDLPPHTTPSVATRCITGWLVIGGIRASRLYIYTPQMQLASEFDATLWFGPSAKISAALELPPGHILLGVSGVMRSSSENGHGHGAIVEIQRDNPRVIWEPGTGLLAEPTGLDATDRSTVLIADARRHTVTEIDFLGSIRWRFGSPGKPGGGKLLREPRDARVTALGYLITDSLNDRILEVDRAGRIVSVIDRRLNTSNGKYESALSAPDLVSSSSTLPDWQRRWVRQTE